MSYGIDGAIGWLTVDLAEGVFEQDSAADIKTLINSHQKLVLTIEKALTMLPDCPGENLLRQSLKDMKN